jgi:hypothetical protein
MTNPISENPYKPPQSMMKNSPPSLFSSNEKKGIYLLIFGFLSWVFFEACIYVLRIEYHHQQSLYVPTIRLISALVLFFLILLKIRLARKICITWCTIMIVVGAYRGFFEPVYFISICVNCYLVYVLVFSRWFLEYFFIDAGK